MLLSGVQILPKSGSDWLLFGSVAIQETFVQLCLPSEVEQCVRDEGRFVVVRYD